MDSLSGPGPSRLAVWWHALRPKTLSLSVAPVALGSTWAAVEGGAFDPLVLVLAMLAAMAIQIGTNLWNDALDAERGVDGGRRLGPLRATAAGLIRAAVVRRAALAAFLTAMVAGAGLVLVSGPLILAIGVAGIACGLLYSAGPLPIAATPAGELVVLAFFGIAGVVGTVVAHGAAVTAQLGLLGVLTGLPAAAVLLVNNHRDRVTDRRSGRRTLAILLGPRRTCRLYAALLLAACAAPPVAAGLSVVTAVASAGLLTAASALAKRLERAPIDGGLNQQLALTARFQLLVVGTTAVAIVLTL